MEVLTLTIDRSGRTPLIKQVYDQIRIMILRGDLRAGEKMPSSRRLAGDLGISRIIIVDVYEQLLSEGYLASRPATGTYVAAGATILLGQTPSIAPRQASKADEKQDLIDFRSGVPALKLFPRVTWARLVTRICKDYASEVFGYDQAEGVPQLRVALASYLARSRRVMCTPEQIVISTGAVQALSLVSRILLRKSGVIMIEDPITNEVQRIFQANGADLFPISVDEAGMQTEKLPADGKPDFIFVTPSHQFPLGSVLSIQRRIQLIEYARAKNCYIVEDDYDSEFRYSGTPVSSLRELDPERVIYIGTFSKTLSPALRLGYIVLPFALVDELRRVKHLTDRHSPVLEQLALARLIEEGFLERHVFTMKKIYRKRRQALVAALNREFSDAIKISGDSTGLHLVTSFLNKEITPTFVSDLVKLGVRIYPVETHTIRVGFHREKAILGYGNLEIRDIDEGVRRIKKGYSLTP